MPPPICPSSSCHRRSDCGSYPLLREPGDRRRAERLLRHRRRDGARRISRWLPRRAGVGVRNHVHECDGRVARHQNAQGARPAGRGGLPAQYGNIGRLNLILAAENGHPEPVPTVQAGRHNMLARCAPTRHEHRVKPTLGPLGGEVFDSVPRVTCMPSAAIRCSSTSSMSRGNR